MSDDFPQLIQEKQRRDHRMGCSLLCGCLLFISCFAIYFVTQTDYVQKNYIYPYPYRETVEHYASVYGVDRNLAASVILAESHFKNDVHSHRGAVGLMQLMPETAAWIASQMGDKNFSVKHLHDPAVNIRYGLWYLSSLEREFQGNDILALAAYNAGRGNVHEWIEHYGWRSDFSEIEEIPYAETREYIRKVFLFRYHYERLYP